MNAGNDAVTVEDVEDERNVRMVAFEVEDSPASPTSPLFGNKWSDLGRESTTSAKSMTGMTSLFGHWRPGNMSEHDVAISWETVIEEESRFLKDQNDRRITAGKRTDPFALAFSGGGIRAAAFQAGVLWRLAKCNMLKDVEYLAAVSGGGYIASAFTSFLHGEIPKDGDVQSWYAQVVAKTLARMQENSGNFVRDCLKKPFGPYDGAGVAHRWLDLPMLLVNLAVAIAINPIVFLVCVLVPFTGAVELFFGAGMRAAFCTQGDGWVEALVAWSYVRSLLWATGIFFVLSFLNWLVSSMIPCCKLQKGDDGKWTAPRGYLFKHSANAFLVRSTAFLCFLVVFVFAMPSSYIAIYSWDEATKSVKHAQCALFIQRLQKEKENGKVDCANMHQKQMWFEDREFMGLRSPTLAEQVTVRKDAEQELAIGDSGFAVVTIIWYILLGGLAASIITVPVLGADMSVRILCVAGPLVLFAFTMFFVQESVFGPIFDQSLGVIRGTRNVWDLFQSVSLKIALVILPLYPWIRRGLHIYYKRSLQGNFFKEGKDLNFCELLRNPYCPFLILTGTSSDYQYPGQDEAISELFFSPMHCGGEDLGFLRQPEHRSLAKCTALTGAGCLDAISLTMTHAMSLRFWLEVLNLTWGDYIIFERVPMLWIKKAIQKYPKHASGLDFLLHFLPVGGMWFFLFTLLNVGHHLGHSTANSVTKCRSEKTLYACAVGLMALMLFLSFIPSLPFHDLLASDPLIRQIQQATQYFHVGNRPPRMLYVTDGGVRDCTGLLQLLRRRCRRILLVLAALDPDDNLAVLRTAIQAAHTDKLANFFNIEEPRAGVEVLFEEFQKDKSIPYLHLGVFFAWDPEGSDRLGEVFIVKNRLPPRLQGDLLKPPFSEQEIMGDGEPMEAGFSKEGWGYMTSDQLGPFGCCDCCHTKGLNCGPKFPHGNFVGYMYLSPMWCNSLIRLGYEVSGNVLQALNPLLAGSTKSPTRITALPSDHTFVHRSGQSSPR